MYNCIVERIGGIDFFPEIKITFYARIKREWLIAESFRGKEKEKKNQEKRGVPDQVWQPVYFTAKCQSYHREKVLRISVL